MQQLKKILVTHRQSEPVEQVFEEIVNALKALPDLFNHNDTLVVLGSDGELLEILKPAQVKALFNEVAGFRVISPKGVITCKVLTNDFAQVVLDSRQYRSRFTTLRKICHLPIYDLEFNQVRPGYNPDSGLYYIGQDIPAVEGTANLKRALGDFPFNTQADLTNCVGMLLTGLMPLHFVKGHPGAIVNGNQPEVGKSLLVKVIGTILDGREPNSMSMIPNQEEFEKCLGARIHNHSLIMIDNVRGQGGKSYQIDSHVLERCLTESQLTFRRIGTSELIKRDNDILIFITMNQARMTRDLATRCVRINLELEGNPKDRKFSEPDLLGYVRQNRKVILAELSGMVERWKSAGRPNSTTTSRFGLTNWAGIIGGILEVNGFEGFLKEVIDDHDELQEQLSELATGNVGLRMIPSDWLVYIQSRNVFGSSVNAPNLKGKQTQLGRLLKSLVGRRVVAENHGREVLVELKCYDHGDRREYVFEEVSEVQAIDCPDQPTGSAGPVRPTEAGQGGSVGSVGPPSLVDTADDSHIGVRKEEKRASI